MFSRDPLSRIAIHHRTTIAVTRADVLLQIFLHMSPAVSGLYSYESLAPWALDVREGLPHALRQTSIIEKPALSVALLRASFSYLTRDNPIVRVFYYVRALPHGPTSIVARLRAAKSGSAEIFCRICKKGRIKTVGCRDQQRTTLC